MALETVNVSVNTSTWVQVGDNVTALTMTETLVGDIKVHVVANGGTAPSSTAAAYQWWDKEYTYSGSAADIYVLSPNGATEVGVVRE